MHRVTIALASLGALLAIIAIVLVIGLAAETGFAGRSFRNVSPGMEPTLLAGDEFSVRPLTPARRSAIGRGELVTHLSPTDRTRQFVKRVIGIPGDTVGMVAGTLRLNGRSFAEPYAWHADSTSDPAWDDFQWQRNYLVIRGQGDSAAYDPTRDNWGPITVPGDSYFVLGDNRDNSLDSRYWGFVPSADMQGQPRRVYFSQDPKSHQVRWERLGHRLR